ncbi:MAG: HlyD family efflux transporter periplasmic adaptor subunit [Deltaproteobacteria bacterium]|nr:HlyD family efflux transporter periplasmic adaptor subunit [Deltaproteobacteria bacterium]
MAGKKIRRIIVLLVLAACASTGIYFYLQHNGGGEKSGLRLYGNIDIRQVRVAFHDTGRISKILVSEGDAVKQGQELAEIDPVRYQAGLQRAQAVVGAREQILSRLLAGSRPEEIKAAEARVANAGARVADARQAYERTSELEKTEFASKQKLDHARAMLNAARAALDAEKQALALAVKGPRKEDIAAAKNNLEADMAALALAKQEMADTRLYAPAAGIIRDRILEPGDMAFPQTPVLTLSLTNPVWVRAYVSETNLGKIAPGMPAAVTTDSFPGKTFAGWIGFISPTAEFTPKTIETEELRTRLVYEVRVFVCNPENKLRLGMPATVEVLAGKKPAPLLKGGKNPCGVR